MQLQDIRDRLERSVGGASNLASMYSARTMRDLDRRAAHELDSAAQTVLSSIEAVAAALKREGLEDHSQFDPEEFVAAFVRKWAAYQHAGSRVANWMVTGPANFPVERNRKRMDTEHRRWQELDAFAKGAPAAAVKAAKRAKARALGPDGVANAELDDLRKRLADRQLAQRHMKAANEIIRREKLGEGDGAKLAELMSARGFPMSPNRGGMILQPNYMGKGGYEGWQLSNNNAEIKRLEGRIRDVEAKLGRMESAGDSAPVEREINGVRIVEDLGDDRIRLIFDGKPAPDVISALKGRGFRWSPSNGAWQRQLTNNARWAAECVANAVAA